MNEKAIKYDLGKYRLFTRKYETEKAIHTLQGILYGLAMDNEIIKAELAELHNWVLEHKQYADLYPFKELLPFISNILNEELMTQEQHADLVWFCLNINDQNEYSDMITADIRKLHGILHGILLDRKITKDELVALDEWLNSSEHLIGCYPYDEVYSLVSDVLKDNVVTPEEEKMLKVFFSDFVHDVAPVSSTAQEEFDELKKSCSIKGVCAMAPDIVFEDKLFCFTGKSESSCRAAIVEKIESKGGKYKDSITSDVDYLIIGNAGNPCWAYSCYGRKVESAIKLRKKGNKVLIVNEVDFWDALVE